MVEGRRLDGDDRVGHDHPVEGPRRAERLAGEAPPGGEAEGLHLPGVDLGHLDREGVLVGQVPHIAGELARYAVRQARGPVEAERRVTGEEETEELVEAHEVVHVGVRHENGLDGQEERPGHPVDAPEVEQQGAPLPAQGDEEGGIAGLPVQQAGPEGRFHGRRDSREAPRRAPARSLAGLTPARYKTRPWRSGRSRRSGGNGSRRPSRPAAPGGSRSPLRSNQVVVRARFRTIGHQRALSERQSPE